jgi:predicted nuclease of predicted toxin-antitoxin system
MRPPNQFVADENVDKPIVDYLRSAGYSVDYVLEHSSGISDQQVLDQINQTPAILITADKDFGELIYRLNYTTHGVILLRLEGLSLDKKSEILAAALKEHINDFPKNFTVISPSMIRIRKTH